MAYSFPFGQQISAVRQINEGTKRKLFVLGVYASAVHDLTSGDVSGTSKTDGPVG